MSCAPLDTRYHRITVTRGGADGVGSCWLHDHVEIGQTVEVAKPRGKFFPDEESTRPVLLLSGGVGLTPMVSMLYRLDERDREVHFLHACENGEVHALRDEVLACVSPTIQSLTFQTDPDAWAAEGEAPEKRTAANAPLGEVTFRTSNTSA